jgi:hypothetical protein
VVVTADGLGTVAIMRQTGKSKSVVWRWQERFMQVGVDGLLRDKIRQQRILPLAQPVIDRVVALTSTDPPGQTTHWTAAAMPRLPGCKCGSTPTVRTWGTAGLHSTSLRSGSPRVKSARRIRGARKLLGR